MSGAMCGKQRFVLPKWVMGDPVQMLYLDSYEFFFAIEFNWSLQHVFCSDAE